MGCGGSSPKFLERDFWQLTTDKQGNLKQWILPRQKLFKNYGKIHRGAIKCIAVSPNGKYLFTSDDKGFLQQWDINTCIKVKDYGIVHNSAIISMAVSIDGKYLFTGAENGFLKQFSTEKRVIAKSLDKVHKAPITSMACTPDNKFLLTCSLREVKQWSVGTCKQINDYTQGLNGDQAFSTICVAPDSKFFYSFAWDGEINQWSLQKKAFVKELLKNETISSFMVSHDGNYQLQGDSLGGLRQLCLKENKIIDTFKNHQKNISCVLQTSDCQSVYTSDWNGCVQEFELESKKCINWFGEISKLDDDGSKAHGTMILSIAIANLHEELDENAAKAPTPVVEVPTIDRKANKNNVFTFSNVFKIKTKRMF